MDFILLSFFFIYYYFIVIVVFLTSYALYYADRRCFSIFARWDESLVGQTATLEVMINIRMQLSLMLHRVYLEVLRKVSYMRPVHNVCTGTQVLHWNLSEVFLDNRQPLPMLAQEGPAVINVSAGPDLGLLVWESCWRRSVVCTGRRRIFEGWGTLQNPASANEPENFRMYSLLEGYKILNLTPQFGVHRLCHYGGNLIVIEKCYSWQNWKKQYSWSVKWKKNHWHWCMDAINLHCRKLRTDRWKSLRNVVVSIKEVWVLFLKFFMYLSNVSPGSP